MSLGLWNDSLIRHSGGHAPSESSKLTECSASRGPDANRGLWATVTCRSPGCMGGHRAGVQMVERGVDGRDGVQTAELGCGRRRWGADGGGGVPEGVGVAAKSLYFPLNFAVN